MPINAKGAEKDLLQMTAIKALLKQIMQRFRFGSIYDGLETMSHNQYVRIDPLGVPHHQ